MQKEYLKNKPKYKQKKVRLNIWEKERERA